MMNLNRLNPIDLILEFTVKLFYREILCKLFDDDKNTTNNSIQQQMMKK